MKKFISLFLCAVMLLIPITVFAEDSSADKPVMMGDINHDGKITASDARKVLRMSAFLESSENVSYLSYDVDGNGKLSAADARIILRKAAGLGEFTYGFDANGVPNSMKAIKSNTFILGASLDDMAFTIVKKGDNVRVLGVDPGGSMAQMGMEDCGVMYNDGMLYMTYKNKGNDIAMYIPESMYETMGISLDDIKELADSISVFLPDNAGIPEKQTVDGKTMYFYSINDGDMKCRITMDSYGIIKTVDNLDDNGEISDSVIFSKINAQVDSSYFDMSRFEII